MFARIRHVAIYTYNHAEMRSSKRPSSDEENDDGVVDETRKETAYRGDISDSRDPEVLKFLDSGSRAGLREHDGAAGNYVFNVLLI